MRSVLAALLVLAFASPVLASNPSPQQQDEVAACVIGHAALMVTRGTDVETAESKAFDMCPAIKFDDEDMAEGWEEFILNVLYDIGA